VCVHEGYFWESSSESLGVKWIAEIAFYFVAGRLLSVKQRPEDRPFKILVPAALRVSLV
jgi:hypothetical protein